MTTTLEKLAKLESEMKACVESFNVALSKNDYEGMTTAEADLKVKESAYSGLAMNRFFEEVSDREDQAKTVLQAATKLNYTTLSHTLLKDDGEVVGMALKPKEIQFDLARLFRYNKFNQDWINYVQKFNLLLTLRAAQQLLKKDEELKPVIETINDSYFMRDKAKEIELGGTPTSNNQLCKQLQAVIDKILFVATEDDPEQNIYRVNNRDVAYLLMCYTKRGRSALKVVCAKHSFVQKLITDILHRVVTNGRYDLDYQVKKQG